MLGWFAERVVVSTSCSLMHTAVDLKNETKLDSELKSWLAFAAQKVLEVVALANAISGKKDEVCCQNNMRLQPWCRSIGMNIDLLTLCWDIWESVQCLNLSVDSSCSLCLLITCVAGISLCQCCCTGIKEVFPKGSQQGSAGGCKFPHAIYLLI